MMLYINLAVFMRVVFIDIARGVGTTTQPEIIEDSDNPFLYYLDHPIGIETYKG